MTKCAEHGVDGRILLKEAGRLKLKIRNPFKAVGRFLSSFGEVKSPIGEIAENDATFTRAARDPRTAKSTDVPAPTDRAAFTDYEQAVRAAGLDEESAAGLARSLSDADMVRSMTSGDSWRTPGAIKALAGSERAAADAAARFGVRNFNVGRTGRVVGDALKILAQ